MTLSVPEAGCFRLPKVAARSAAADWPAPDDLISVFKAVRVERCPRVVRDPRWLLLLWAVLGILSG